MRHSQDEGHGAAERVLEAFGGMTREQFLGNPKITKDSNGADLRAKAFAGDEAVPFEPFMSSRSGEKFGAKFTPTSCTVHDRENGDRVVGTYSNYGRGASTLVVDKAYRRKGIGSEMMYQWRLRHPAAQVADSRTKKSQALQESVWLRVQAEVARAKAALAIDSQVRRNLPKP